MAKYTGPTSFKYNPFSATKVMRDAGGNTQYRQAADGTWLKGVARSPSGDMDFSPTQYDWVPIQGTPQDDFQGVPSTYGPDQNAGLVDKTLTSENELGYNYADFEKNDPELAKDWTTYDGGGFMRDGMGYVNAKLVGYDEKTGTYALMQKTADKEGTIRYFRKNEQGGVDYVGDGETVPWDTNKNVTEQTAFQVAKVAAGPLMAYGANQLAQAAGLAGNAAAAGSGLDWASGAYGSMIAPNAFSGAGSAAAAAAEAGTGVAGQAFDAGAGDVFEANFTDPGPQNFTNIQDQIQLGDPRVMTNNADIFEDNFTDPGPQNFENIQDKIIPGDPRVASSSVFEDNFTDPGPQNFENIQDKIIPGDPRSLTSASDALKTAKDVGKSAWDFLNSSPLAWQLAGGALKLLAGLYSDKKNEKAYNELIARIDQSQNVTGLKIPKVGGLMSTMVKVPEFDAYKIGRK